MADYLVKARPKKALKNLKVWLDSKTTLEHPVDLTDGATLQVDFP